MVNKQHYNLMKELNGGLPPQDESWWEAVLAEDDPRPTATTNRGTPPAPFGAKTTSTRLPAETPPVDWGLAQRYFEQDRVCTLQVTGYNRGGLLVTGEGLHGFVPVSHLIELAGEKEEAEQKQILASYVNHKIRLKVIECDQERGRVVFSERAALANPGSRNILLNQLQSGDCVSGTVTNITEFGVFIDLGGVEGLIHVSEISWGRVRHPSDVVHYGQDVEVYVINVDQDRSRVGLSLKRLHPNPWETAEERYFPGQIVNAVITSIVSFGAFARLEEGLDGLIHISEMNSIDGQPADTLDEGQQVLVRVLHVDASKQRLGLSLKTDE